MLLDRPEHGNLGVAHRKAIQSASRVIPITQLDVQPGAAGRPIKAVTVHPPASRMFVC